MNAHLDEMKREAQSRGVAFQKVKQEFEGDLDMITAAEHQRYEDDMAELYDLQAEYAEKLQDEIERGRESFDPVYDFILEGEVDNGPLLEAMTRLIKGGSMEDRISAGEDMRRVLQDAVGAYAWSVAEDMTLDDFRDDEDF